MSFPIVPALTAAWFVASDPVPPPNIAPNPPDKTPAKRASLVFAPPSLLVKAPVKALLTKGLDKKEPAALPAPNIPPRPAPAAGPTIAPMAIGATVLSILPKSKNSCCPVMGFMLPAPEPTTCLFGSTP